MTLWRRIVWPATALAAAVLVAGCGAPAALAPPTSQPTDVPPTAAPTSAPALPSATAVPAGPTRTPVLVGPQPETPSAGPTATPFATTDIPSKGPASAKVTIVEFSDFQ